MTRRKTKTSTGLQTTQTKINVTISPESKSTLDKIIDEIGLSRSAFVEGILNGSISLSSQTATQIVNLSSASEDKGLEVHVSDEVEEVKPTVSASADNEELKVQKERILALEKQIKEQEKEISKSNDLNKSLQQKLDDQQASVANLKNELDLAKTTSKTSDNHKELTNLINQKEETIKQLNQEINRLKDDIYQTKQKDVVITQSSHDLEHLNKRQKETIAYLEARIAELQTVASIGSHALNKWRSKAYR